MEGFLGKRLKAVDQHGVALGDEYIKRWPKWLPKDWRIAYLREPGFGSVKPCFLGPTGVHYADKKAVLTKTEADLKERRIGRWFCLSERHIFGQLDFLLMNLNWKTDVLQAVFFC